VSTPPQKRLNLAETTKNRHSSRTKCPNNNNKPTHSTHQHKYLQHHYLHPAAAAHNPAADTPAVADNTSAVDHPVAGNLAVVGIPVAGIPVAVGSLVVAEA
jgi:hypothetical protein